MENHPEPLKIDDELGYDKNILLDRVKYEDYAKAPGMNASGLKELIRSPEHYYEYRYNHVEPKDTDSKLKGRLTHFAVLEPEMFMDTHVVEPVFEGYTQKGELTTNPNCKEVKEAKAKWYAELKPDAIVVPSEMLTALTGMTTKILKHPRAKNLLRDGVRETTLFWDDPETGELCKARPDFVTSKGHLVDLKTANDASPIAFERAIVNFKYWLQAAHYCAGAKATNTAKHDKFIFLVIETSHPYGISLHELVEEDMYEPQRRRANLMQRYAHCKRTNTWPGYDVNINRISIPPWYDKDIQHFQEDENAN